MAEVTITIAQIEKSNIERNIALLIMKYEEFTGTKIERIDITRYGSLGTGDSFKVHVDVRL